MALYEIISIFTTSFHQGEIVNKVFRCLCYAVSKNDSSRPKVNTVWPGPRLPLLAFTFYKTISLDMAHYFR